MTTSESVSYSLIGWGTLALILALSIALMWAILRADVAAQPCDPVRDGLPLAGVITTTGGAVDKCLYEITSSPQTHAPSPSRGEGVGGEGASS